MTSTLADQFMGLFEGLKRAHGTYRVEGVEQEAGGKISIRPSASTVLEPVTRELWEQHLAGTRSLGIVPIDDAGTCCFGVIDVDVYQGLSHQALCKKLQDFGLPLVVARSKSGGAHLFLFTDERVPASVIRAKLSELSAALGYANSEIFPKQTKLLTERGDTGSWINMPYFGEERRAITADGNLLSAREFVDLALRSRVSKDQLTRLGIRSERTLEEGPPCLEHLIGQGFPKGTRNNGLYNLGVYLKKVFPDSWQHKIHEWNIKYMDPPLTSEETVGVIKSLDRRDYRYTCSKPPIQAHCNSSLCKIRKFGIGADDPEFSFPKLHSLTKFDSQPPIWFIDIEGAGRLELTTEELQSQQRFQRKCMEYLNMMPQPVKNQAWAEMVNSLMSRVMVIRVPEDASAVGQLFSMVEQFCTGRARAKTMEEILLGKPYHDQETDTYYFRISDLVKFLERQHFREFKVHQITSKLKDKGAEYDTIELKGRKTTVWKLHDLAKMTGGFNIPKEVSDVKPPY